VGYSGAQFGLFHSDKAASDAAGQPGLTIQNTTGQQIHDSAQQQTQTITGKIDENTGRITTTVDASGRQVTMAVNQLEQTMIQLAPQPMGFWKQLLFAAVGSVTSSVTGGLLGGRGGGGGGLEGGIPDPHPGHPSTPPTLQFRKHAEGGLIKGPGTGTSDSIPSLLSNGEFVMRAAAVERYGADYFAAMNEGRAPKDREVHHHYAPVIHVNDPCGRLSNTNPDNQNALAHRIAAMVIKSLEQQGKR
jgi:hypothetical protein